MSVSFSPIGPWLVVVVAALGVTVLTVWAYQQRLRGTQGRWRWVALGLRLAAVLLCVLAAFRPSLVIQEKKKQPAAIVFLIDDSASMQLNDEVRGQTRWGIALKTLSQVAGRARGSRPEPGREVLPLRQRAPRPAARGRLPRLRAVRLRSGPALARRPPATGGDAGGHASSSSPTVPTTPG